MCSTRSTIISVLFYVFFVSTAAAETMRPNETITLGKPALDVEFIDDKSGAFRLSDLRGKPVVVSPIFTSCPHTCGMITQSLRGALTAIGPPGGKYEVLTVSFDPADTPDDLAAYRKEQLLPGRWRLATAEGEAMERFLASLDFRYTPDPAGGFEHANLVAVLTPDLKISEYVYGVMFEERPLRTALQTAVTGPSLVQKFRGWIVLAAVTGGLATLFAVVFTRGRRSTEPA